MKNLAASLLSLVLLTTACKKEADPQPMPPPAPVQAASLDLNFDFYATATLPATTQSASFLATKPAGQVFTDRLAVKFEVRNVIDAVSDRVEFVLPISKQKPGLVGSYSLASQPNTGAGDVLIAYFRLAGANSGAFDNAYSSNFNVLEGSFIITAYDATRQLITGSYVLTARNVRGPFTFLAVGSAGDPGRRGDLRLTGTFVEVPLQK